jgi:hypothetical protein
VATAGVREPFGPAAPRLVVRMLTGAPSQTPLIHCTLALVEVRQIIVEQQESNHLSRSVRIAIAKVSMKGSARNRTMI